MPSFFYPCSGEFIADRYRYMDLTKIKPYKGLKLFFDILH